MAQPKWNSIILRRTVVVLGTPESGLKSSCLIVTLPRMIVPKSGIVITWPEEAPG